MSDLATWVGTSERRTDVITAAPIRLLAATFDRQVSHPRPGDPLPPMWHWLFFLPDHARSGLGEDGHPKRGGFMPPVPLKRRMFAGGSTRLVAPLAVGDTVERFSQVISVVEKVGRSGRLVFVETRHDLSTSRGLAVSEEQTIVYTDAPPAPVTPADAGPPDAAWRREVATDTSLLFRFSALTFNGHRIHYDTEYATSVEGYPGLVVQGPLVALLLLDLATSNDLEKVTGFSFQARSPLYVGECLELRGDPTDIGAELGAYTSDGRLAMTATVTR